MRRDADAVTLDRYAQWVERGRAHQAQHRYIDALICYRRAQREMPSGSDAQFHVGEIAWRLGNASGAIGAWRAATEARAEHVAAWHALAEAFAATGDLAQSMHAIDRVLALRPQKARAKALRILLEATRADVADAALADAVRIAKPPLSLLAALAARIFAEKGRLASPQATTALVDAASRVGFAPGEEDALRHIALALARAGEMERAAAFAGRYAEACLWHYRRSMPLLWPLRSAGDRVRVGVLLSQERRSDGAAALRDNLVRAGLIGSVQLYAFAFVPDEPSQKPAADDALPLPLDARKASRAVAALDLDVLIDLAGVREASGPLLALRPARNIWLVAQVGLPVAHALGDRAFALPEDGAQSGERAAGPGLPAIPASLTAALRALCEEVAAAPLSPSSADELTALFESAVRAHQQDDPIAAREGYERVLREQPGHAPTLYLCGMLARADGDDLAREHFRAALRAAPEYEDARVALVGLLATQGSFHDATAIARAGIDMSPASAPLWRALAHAELKRGDAAAAEAAYEAALKLDPVDGETHYNHGVALQAARRVTDAARAYQRALAFRPDDHAAHFNLGVIFEEQGNVEGAIAAFRNVLRQVPDHAAAYKALAEILLAAGRIDAWFENFERFERNCPNRLTLAAHALEVCAYRADFARLARYLDELHRSSFGEESPEQTLDALQQLLYLLHFFDVEPWLIGRYAKAHDALARSVYGEPMPRRSQRVPGRVRIGYLSGDFRNHVMGKMMWEALRRHDRARFELIGYSTSDARDDWTARLGTAFSRLDSLGALSDRAAAERIAQDDLDVLVDLSTHTKGARPGILALKPARVQITHVASAGTLAMSAVDFKLTDRYADVEHDPEAQIEPPLAMEGCVYPYRHIEPAVAGGSRDTLGIAGDAITIGAFCTPLKLSQRCLALWREVLARIPRARLALSPIHPSLRSVFTHIAETAGIDPRRLVFVPQGRDDAENQARYRLIDFVLDPLPYGGVNGTLEALDMGVPVVTLVGRRHAERTSYSILSNLGVPETIAQSGGDYVAIAERLAVDRAFMRAVRERIAAALRRSPLTDMDAHTRNLEAAYLRALVLRAPEALADAEQ